MSTLVLFLLIFQFLRSQNPGTQVSGLVFSTLKTPLAGATVVLLRSGDSRPVQTVLTDSLGAFSFGQPAYGNYRLSITAVGMAAWESEAFSLTADQPNIQMNHINLQPKQDQLKEVTVSGQKKMIEQKADRTIVNVDAAVTNSGATVLEVLEKSPGISVDKDGNISLKGKQGVIVMMDGKPTYLAGSDLSNMLSSMNANQLDRLEIMPNPPAKYDAAGNSGIINLVTKKNKAKGFNGSLSAGYSQGKYWKTNNSLNLNYRNAQFNLFLNYSDNLVRGYTDLHIMRQYFQPDHQTIYENFDQPTYLDRRYFNHTLKLGMDYFLSSKTTLGIVSTGFISPSRFSGSSTGYLQDAAKITDSISFTASDNHNRWKNGTINLNFRHEFKAGEELTADADYIHYSATSTQNFLNRSTWPDGQIISTGEIRGDLPTDINISSVKADYTKNLAKEAKLEAGFKSSLVKTANDADYFNLENGEWQPDYEKTNHFLYRENINAAYATLHEKSGKWSIQAGLRFENTNYKGDQLGNIQKPDSSFNQHYNNLFPTVYIGYAADSLNQLSFSYGRRIDRPAYQDLNPFIFYINAYTYQVGNPYLLPQYTNHLEVSHTYRSFLTTGLSYDYTNHYFTQLFRTHGDTTLLGNGNLGTMETIGGSVNAEITVSKWWTSILHLDINYKKVQGEGGGININSYGLAGQLNINNQFHFQKGWAAELSAFYNTRDVEAQFVIKPLYAVSAGVSKQVMKGQGTLKLNVRDIFFSQVVDGRISYQNVVEHFIQSRDSRVGTLSFSWRFGKPLKQQVPHRNNGATEEQNRVRVG